MTEGHENLEALHIVLLHVMVQAEKRRSWKEGQGTTLRMRTGWQEAEDRGTVSAGNQTQAS